MQQPKLKSKVRCTDRDIGEVTKVVLDPLSHEISHIVVSINGSGERQVEMGHVQAVMEDLVELRAPSSDIAALPPFKRDDYVTTHEVEISHLEDNLRVTPDRRLTPFPMATASRPIFLSYASQDAEAARRIAETLGAAGLEVWFDKSELRGGDAWDASIRKQIRACALFMPVISANTRARAEGYFRLEWKLAVDRSHLMAAEKPFLLPVVIDSTREADALVPDRFREVQWTFLQAGAVPADFVERIARLLVQGDRVVSPAGPPRPGPWPPAAPRMGTAIDLLAVLPFPMDLRFPMRLRLVKWTGMRLQKATGRPRRLPMD